MHSTESLDRLCDCIYQALTIPVEASGRHVHLSRADVDSLFGMGYELTPKKYLSQPEQYACQERLTLVTPKGTLENVGILAPTRPQTQVELSLTDALSLGLRPPVRLSGDLQDSTGLLLRHGNREIRLAQGVIVAQRHIHMTPQDARRFGVTDGQQVRLRVFGTRPLTFEAIPLRISESSATVAHLDYDEANACGYTAGVRGLMLL